MKKCFIKILLFFLLTSATTALRAQVTGQGCTLYDPIYNYYIYTTEIGDVSPKRYYLWGSYVTHSATMIAGYCETYYNNIISSGPLGSCKVNYAVEPNSTTTTYTYDGYLVTFALFCPLDNEVWILILVVCGCGCIMIRQRCLSRSVAFDS
jgi:hypothetical protein